MDAGTRIFVGWSRQFDQKSLAIFARAEYGLGVIPYDFFNIKDNTGTPITVFKSIILRNSRDDWYRTMFRDAFLQTMCDGMNLDKQAYKPAIVFLNGEYWGIHNIREKVNEDYLAAHYDYVDTPNVDILKSYDSDIMEGDDSHFMSLLDYVNFVDVDMSQAASYDYVKTQIDISNFIDYHVAQVFTNNTDWPYTNIKYWRPW
jgi:hypothetical protein